MITTVKYHFPTFSGKRFDITTVDPSMICLADIAHALSNICRYNGHCSRFYSVAEHSVRLVMVAPDPVAAIALLHDATEAYMCDIPRPIKILPEMEAYREYEDRLNVAIMTKFWEAGKQWTESKEMRELRRLDQIMPYVEMRLAGLYRNHSHIPQLPGESSADDIRLAEDTFRKIELFDPSAYGWHPMYAESKFLSCADKLGLYE